MPRLTTAFESATLTAGEGRKLSGTAVPFGVASAPAMDGQRYRFAGGPDNGMLGVATVRGHDDDAVEGVVSAETAHDDRLEVEVVLLDTQLGRDGHAEAAARVRNGFSVSFDPVECTEADDGVIDVTRWNVRHLGHVRRAAFGDATPAIAASAQTEEVIVAATTTEVPPTVDLAPLNARLDQLEARALEVRQPEPPRLSVREAFALQFTASRPAGRLLALADVISSGNSGVLPPVWSSEVRNTLDGMRYLFPHVGKVAFPSSGYTLTLPKVINHTTVGPRGTEKTQIPSSALTTGQDIYSATWYAGGVDIALEVVLQSDPSIVAIVVDDLLRAYAAVTDQALTSALEAAGTPAGSTLDTTTYAAFVADVVTAGDQIRVATGQFGDRLSLTTASWKKVIGMVDQQGRRILSTGGATNADGSAQLTAGAVDIGGITVFHNPRAAEDMQFNTVSARVAERPPVQVQADNVALMGRDLGILGAMMDLPVYPAGIVVHSATVRAGTQQGGPKR